MRGDRIVAVAAAGWSVLAATSGAPQTMPPAELGQYVVLAREAVSVRSATRVAGGAVGAIDGTVTLARGARVAGVVVASTVRVGRGAHVDRLFCGLVMGPPVLPACRAFTAPVVDPALLSPVVATPGALDLTVRRHTGTAPIAAGSFRDIAVRAGALLQLAGGSYAARSIRLGRAARLVCVAACRLTVAGDVLLRRGAELGAAPPQRAETVRLDVAGTTAGPALSTRPHARINATFYAPDGAILLGAAGSYRGAYVGRSVTIGPNATVRADSAL